MHMYDEEYHQNTYKLNEGKIFIPCSKKCTSLPLTLISSKEIYLFMIFLAKVTVNKSLTLVTT